jgi:hypothetical protein
MTEMIQTRTLAPKGLERYGGMVFTDLPVALTLAIGRAAVADVKRPPAANLVACAGRAIAGMRVIPPPGGSRRRECRVEDKERGGDGRDQNEMHFAHRSDPCECSLPTEAAAGRDLSKRVSEATISVGACLLTFAVGDHALAFLLAIFYARRPGLELGLGQSRTCHAGEADRHNSRHDRRPDEMHFAHRIAPF